MMFIWFFLIVALIYILWNNNDFPQKKQQATRILDERYARGDISTEEYNTIKQQLKEGNR